MLFRGVDGIFTQFQRAERVKSCRFVHLVSQRSEFSERLKIVSACAFNASELLIDLSHQRHDTRGFLWVAGLSKSVKCSLIIVQGSGIVLQLVITSSGEIVAPRGQHKLFLSPSFSARAFQYRKCLCIVSQIVVSSADAPLHAKHGTRIICLPIIFESLPESSEPRFR